MHPRPASLRFSAGYSRAALGSGGFRWLASPGSAERQLNLFATGGYVETWWGWASSVAEQEELPSYWCKNFFRPNRFIMELYIVSAQFPEGLVHARGELESRPAPFACPF